MTNGPLWFDNYGLYGMQWGAKQLFSEVVPAYLKAHPDQRLLISPSWANATDVLMRFFDVDPQRAQLLNIDYFIHNKQPLDENTILVMIPEEIDRANASGKFAPLEVVQQVNAQPANTVVVASGTSCRHQLEHLTTVHPKHMAELLADAI